MATINPINQITEDSFTSTSRGLMTLFVIGVVKIVLGVEFTTSTIAIPWLPKVELLHLDKLIYLYWGLVAYAIYRYSLYKATAYRELWFESLGSSLQFSTTLGSKFVHKNIFTDSEHYEVKVRKSGFQEDAKCISLFQYADLDEVACSFDIQFDRNYKFQCIDCSVNPHYSSEGFAVNVQSLNAQWGFFHYFGGAEPDPDEGYRTDTFGGKSYRFHLFGLTFLSYAKLFATDKRAFDLVLPVLFNLGLFTYWITNYVSP